MENIGLGPGNDLCTLSQVAAEPFETLIETVPGSGACCLDVLR